MPGRDEHAWDGGEEPSPAQALTGLPSLLAALARSLEAESDRWFLWIPVLFAGGIARLFRASRRARSGNGR